MRLGDKQQRDFDGDAAGGEREFSDDLRGGFGDAAGDDRCVDSRLFMESGRRHDSFHYGIAGFDHDLQSAGDGWNYRMHQFGQ